MMFSQLSQGDPNAFQYSIFSILVAGYIEKLTHSSSPYTLKLLLEQPVYLCQNNGVNVSSVLFCLTNIAGDKEGNTGNSLGCQCLFSTMGT